ncbi:DJ-1/PfpI family protein [Halopseudomonas salina]|uniref:Glutamine amidotransferase n=1 Tax=Halopseudomonas salina TaxID=1323744 RepID=A0ABQ1PTR0_9GAMM|nr:DJ-1/PfpI family protein [Halopseudomonas salina]GGD03735.1 glutamine amidotransferase [Halopseudomonas salina]
MDEVRTVQVGIFVFEDVEVLDFAGPFEVLTTAARVWARSHPQDPPLFNVTLLAETTSVRARAGLLVHTDHSLEDAPHLDLLVIPGGVVTDELEKPHVISWIREAATQCLVASVCTGAFLVAKAGLLDNRRATTHWEDIDDLREQFPQVTVLSDQRWVDEGRVVSSAGISAGIDMSLHLVERLAGRDLAIATARQMEFDWTEAD